ncbi:hypothetical protein TIFTF001_028353 [Ficus carica]|uniref:Uncharacterized protein n=1 Tax=Ficus carica TaxID=3494 RepID=A0AA88DPR9_FICCA|nr:hypothetical protein TIFTF001_028353 [Ficus carica]
MITSYMPGQTGGRARGGVVVEVVCARVTRRGRGAMAVGRMGGETGCGGSDGKVGKVVEL